MILENEILSELRQISKIAMLANAKVIETELGKIANTNDKKKIWVLIDGKRMAKDIAREGDVSERAVNYFVSAAYAANLVNYKKMEPPSKLLEFSPPDWVNLVLEKGMSPNEKIQNVVSKATSANREQSVSDNKGAEKNG
jgi:hypothetical protein